MKILLLMCTMSESDCFYRDHCSYIYSLSKYCGWAATYAYFGKEKLSNLLFEEQCKLDYLGDDETYKERVKKAIQYCKNHSSEFDWIMLMNYGSTTYKLAKAAKQGNKNIKVYCKLDMNKNGFSHFYDGTWLRTLKASIEIVKSRNIDLFSVETKKYYDILKKLFVFKGRIQYIPNCVSLLNINLVEFDRYKKENLIITVGRLGVKEKNIELLLSTIVEMGPDKTKGWKFCIVGPATEAFKEYVNQLVKENPWMPDIVSFMGKISDRETLYSLYSKAKIVCMPSRSEGFGIAIVEGMYFGSYPVATDCMDGIHDIIPDEQNGIIVPNEDKDALASALYNAMNDSNLLKMGEHVKQFVRTYYAYNVWTDKLNGYLRGID